MTKISLLRSFGVAMDGPETIGATMSDREKAELRGSVRTCVEEIITPNCTYMITTEYSPDGKLVTSRTTNSDGSGWVTTHTYNADGRLTKTISGNASEPGTETLYAYDEAGRLLTIMNSPEKGDRTEFHYDEQGRKTAVQNFDARTLQRAQGSMYSGTPWDAAVGAGIGVPVGGHITTIYDGNQPTEAQIYGSEGRIVSRFVCSYDAHGRIIEEKPILENPAASLFGDRFSAEEEAELNDKQLEAMNKAAKLMLSGRSGTGISYAYDAQGHITKIHDRNFAFDEVTTISYNERGDKSVERKTMTGNSTVPIGVPYSMDENGKLIPSNPAAEPTELPDWLREQEIRYAYQYDSYGNWTQLTANHSSKLGEASSIRHRKLTYY